MIRSGTAGGRSHYFVQHENEWISPLWIPAANLIVIVFGHWPAVEVMSGHFQCKELFVFLDVFECYDGGSFYRQTFKYIALRDGQLSFA